MDSNNVVPITGVSYLWSCLGGLSILEMLINVTTIIFMALTDNSTKGNLLIGLEFVATICTTLLLVLHMKGVITRSKLAWHWIECIMVLVIAILLVVFSTIVFTVFVKSYILTGIMGYIGAGVYFVDTLKKYQLAITPVPKYAWTTPNMPDLS